MDVQLQELIEKIKKDGIASAEDAAAGIISEAEKKASAIVEEAKAQAQSIQKEAKAETERLQKAGEDALRQAARNLLISFRDGITSQLKALLEEKTSASYSADLLAKLVPETVKEWSKNSDAANLSVLLSESDLNSLEGAMKAALKEQISKGMEIRADKTLESGFRIGMKDGSAYYDYSAESVAALFSAYLNPRISSIMKAAASEA